MFGNPLGGTSKPKLIKKIVKKAPVEKKDSNCMTNGHLTTRPRLQPQPAAKEKTAKSSKRLSPLPSRSRESSVKKRPTPELRLSSSSDEEDNDQESSNGARKRPKRVDSAEVDPNRRVRLQSAFDEATISPLVIINAADIPAIDTSTKYKPTFPDAKTALAFEIQYPSAHQPEKYLLISPQSDEQAFDAIKDVVEVMHRVAESYVPADQHILFEHESTGFPQRLLRAVKNQSIDDILSVVSAWNAALSRLRKDGSIAKILDSSSDIHPLLVERILNQAYTRTVSPRLKLLHQYEAGGDNVYGELMPRFVSMILKRDIKMRSNQVFVDLGSGIGNVVLQAALEVGCESWGCEMMKHYSEIADLQRAEFVARCELWGLSTGEVHLERGDFLVNKAIARVIPRADVVLVNNQVFSAGLNESIMTMFLDLKDGAKIVSLKPFSSDKVSARTANSIGNILKVQKKQYFSRCVSWTDAGGDYYISTKNSKYASSRFAAH